MNHIKSQYNTSVEITEPKFILHHKNHNILTFKANTKYRNGNNTTTATPITKTKTELYSPQKHFTNCCFKNKGITTKENI